MLTFVTILLTASLVALVTSHLWLVVHIVMRTPARWRGLLALVIPPLAPYWGIRHGLRAPLRVWVLAMIGWVAGLVCVALSSY